MKYTRLLSKSAKFFINLFCFLSILFYIGVLGVITYFDITSPNVVVSLFWVFIVPFTAFYLDVLIGRMMGDVYIRDGTVVDGKTSYSLVKTPKVYKRRIYTYSITCVLYIPVIIRFCLYFKESLIHPIVGIVLSVLGMLLCYLLARSSSEKSKLPFDSFLPFGNGPRKVLEYTFNFKKYPSLEKKYNLWKSLILSANKKEGDPQEFIYFENLAKAVYDIFDPMKPDLIDRKTRDTLQWDTVINTSYINLDFTKKMILVGLLNGSYKYVLPNKFYLK